MGLPFAGEPHYFPTKDEMADYLERYAAHFKLPVRTGVTVKRLSRNGSGYLVETGDRNYEADHVVVAMATYQTPRIPSFARELNPDIVQLHSLDYRNPRQLRPGGVLIVGAGNSGADIAMDLVRSHEVHLAGRHPGHVPFRIESTIARVLLPFIFRVVFHRVLTVDTPMGRRMRLKAITSGMPLIRVKPSDITAAGVTREPRVTGVEAGKPRLADGRVLDVANVIWCTGFHPAFSWIDVPVPGLAEGDPTQVRGAVPGEPGLYFVGLAFLYALSSTMIQGVGRDAERISTAIKARVDAAAVQAGAAFPTAVGARGSAASAR
jgi:putative flavoprotein involved in K+ transport